MQDELAPVSAIAPPVAARKPVTATHHGITLVDDYAWLRADNWQEVMRDPTVLDAQIRAYLEAENAYTAAKLAGTDALQAKLFAEMKGRIKEDDSSVPAPEGPGDCYSSYGTCAESPSLCRRPRGDASGEQIILDGNKEA